MGLRSFWASGRLFTAGLILVGTVAVGATAAQAASARGSARGGTLTIAEDDPITNLDPDTPLGWDYPFANQLFDPLVRFSSTLQPEPGLVTSWVVRNGGKALALFLRHNVRFTNGDLFTSADVKFSIQWAATAANGAEVLKLADEVTAIQTPNQYEVILHYAAPNPAPFDLMNELYIFDAKQGVAAANTSGNGTGPFKLVSFEPGVQVVLARKSNYWGPQAKLQRIVVKSFPSEQTEIEALESGSVNLIYDISAAGYASLRGRSGISGGTVGLLGSNDLAVQFNVNQVPSPLVRQAISLILDRPAIAHAVGGPLAKPLCLPFAPGSPGYFSSLASKCKYDLTTAKADLAKANAAGTTLTVTTTSSDEPVYQLAQIIQNQASQIGLNVQILNQDSQTYGTNTLASNFEMLAKEYSRAAGDPGILFGAALSFYATGNLSLYDNSTYADSVNAAATQLNPTLRSDDYEKAEANMLSSAFIVPVAAMPYYVSYASNVQDIGWNTDGLLVLDGTSVG